MEPNTLNKDSLSALAKLKSNLFTFKERVGQKKKKAMYDIRLTCYRIAIIYLEKKLCETKAHQIIRLH